MPTFPPTVTTSGSTIAPVHTTVVDDDHDIVEHAAVPSRPDGVESLKAKFKPTTDRLLVTCEPGMFITPDRVLTEGATKSFEFKFKQTACQKNKHEKGRLVAIK